MRRCGHHLLGYKLRNGDIQARTIARGSGPAGTRMGVAKEEDVEAIVPPNHRQEESEDLLIGSPAGRPLLLLSVQ